MSPAPVAPSPPRADLASPAAASEVNLDADSARAVLSDLRRSLRDSSGRTRTGLLRVRHGDPGALPRFEHQSSFHLKRPSRMQLQETAQTLLRLFQSAGLSGEAQGQLERYLRDNGDRAQVGRIVELLDEHLPLTGAQASTGPTLSSESER